ncbi:peptidoglycan-binding protein [Streptomyces sp. NPDC003860]
MSGKDSTTERRRELAKVHKRITSAGNKNALIGAIEAALRVSPPVGDVPTLQSLGKRYSEQVDDAGRLGERIDKVAKQGLPEAWVGDTSVRACDVVSAAVRAAQAAMDAYQGGGKALLRLADAIGEAQARDGEGRARLHEARGILGGRDDDVWDFLEDSGEKETRLRARAIATAGIDSMCLAAVVADDAARAAARDLNKWAAEARAGKLATDDLTAADRLALADTSTGAGDPEQNEILSASDLTRAGSRLEQLSDQDKAAVERLLAQAATPEQRAYLLKALAAGNSVPDLHAFHGKIHGHSPEWLREHLSPVVTAADSMVDEGRNRDGSNTNRDDVGFKGQLWIQGGDGSEGTCVASSTVTARAMVDPIYALNLTGGPTGQEDDPAAFRERLVDEQHRLHRKGWGGDDWNGMNDLGHEYISDSAIGRATGDDYDLKSVKNADARRDILPEIQRTVAEGRPIPIGVKGDDSAHAMVIIGQDGDKLQIYNPWGTTTWVSEDDFINGTMGGASSNDLQDPYQVFLPE